MNSQNLTKLDPRINAYREDLADASLRGQINAKRYVDAQDAIVTAPVIDLRSTKNFDQSITHQLLHGQWVSVFENDGQWSWLQSQNDGYVGYAKNSQLRFQPETKNTHRVCVPFTFIYPDADLKRPIIDSLSMGSLLQVNGETEVRGTRYYLLENGNYIFCDHICGHQNFADDYVSVCEKLLNVPYLWGGASAFGIDCSGLVQLAMGETGVGVARDSDMQASEIGRPIDAGQSFEFLQRGDLVFWNGHVAIVQGKLRGMLHIIHANGHTMSVASEPLKDAVNRIAYLYGEPTGFRRP